MKKFITLLLLSLLAVLSRGSSAQEPAPAEFDHEHALFSRVLTAQQRGDRVDYAALSRARGEFDLYLGRLTHVQPQEFATWTRPQQFAFWINAYNAFTLEAVLQNYPLLELDALRDVGGKASGSVYKRKNIHLGHLIAGHSAAEISLDELRDSVLREKFKDARVHAVLNNACLGAPQLRPTALNAAALDRELDAAARAWLADASRTRFSKSMRTVEAPAAFALYREDFARDLGDTAAWITRYAPLDVRTWIELPGAELQVNTVEFDWKLNDIEEPSHN